MEVEFTELSQDLPSITRSKPKKSRSKTSKSSSKRSKKANEYPGQITLDEATKAMEVKEIIKDEDKKSVDNSEVVSIPRSDTGTILSKAIQNKGKYFADKNAELAQAEKHPYYLKDNIMTSAEATLFRLMDQTFNKYLQNIKAEILIFPKIRLADVIDVQDVLKSRRAYFYAIAQKHIDFLIYDKRTMKLICAVELDDIYHTRTDRKARDKFVDETLRSCGVTIFRIDTPIKEVNEGHLTNITDYILDYYSPICCKCGNPMELKRSKWKHNYGHRFYGCIGWKPGGKGCDHTIDID